MPSGQVPDTGDKNRIQQAVDQVNINKALQKLAKKPKPMSAVATKAKFVSKFGASMKKKAAKPVSKTVKRWFNLKMTPDDLQNYLVRLQPKFRKYKLNIFQLNHAALRIQHWFFKKRQEAKRIKYVPFVPTPVAKPVVPKADAPTVVAKSKPVAAKPDQPQKQAQTPQPPSQIIVVQTNNGSFNATQLQELVNSAIRKTMHQAKVPNLRPIKINNLSEANFVSAR